MIFRESAKREKCSEKARLALSIKRCAALLLAVAMLLSLAACTDSKKQGEENIPSDGQAITIKDMIGRDVEIIPGSYKSVVCIGAGALRMYSYINGAELLAGVEDIDNTTLPERPKMFDSVARPYVLAYGESFSKLPSCGVGGPSAQTAEAEKILSCNPDIVISEYEDVDKENALQEQLGVPVITLKAGPSGVYEEAFTKSLELLGKIFGKEDRAAQLVSFVEAEIAEIENRTSGIKEEDKKAVYICGLGNWGTTNHLMTAPNFAQLEKANVKNVVGALDQKGIQAIEAEKFIALGQEMDIMIFDTAAVKNIKPLYAENPEMFSECKAWQNGEAYLQMAYNAYYTNYETALVNAWYTAKIAYPELFADIDMTAKTDEITEAFLGQKLAEKIFAMPANFGGYQKIDTANFFK